GRGGAMIRAPFVMHERVRWSDCDPMGIIRYDAYSRFFEVGEAEMFRSIGVTFAVFAREFGITLPRRVMHLEYPSPPRLDELLELVVYVSEVGGSSLRLNLDCYGEGGVLRMEGYLVLVCVHDGPDRGEALRVKRWPPAFLEKLAPVRLSVDEARAARREDTA
ncbi:MAG TPA: thioesterase family protein, partial [Gemmatimonadaceae bacterium]|nr:thioesterase family protein [Gemmatimonadaceae bacterium]